MAKRDYAAAIAAYGAAIDGKRLPPASLPAAYRSRCRAYWLSGKPELARPDCDKAIELAPKDPANHVERGLARSAARDNAGAVEDFTQALALRPDDREALQYRMQDYRVLGRREEALADASRRVALAPDDVGALRDRAEILRDLGRYDEAAADFARVLDRAPDDAVALFGRGVLEMNRGNHAAAAADLEKYAQRNPSYAYGPIILYLAQERAGRRGFAALARAAARLDLEKWPAPVVHFLLGNMTAPELLAATKNEKPETERNRTCEAEFYLGQAALIGGKKAEALARLGRARDLCPPNFLESPWAAAELKRLEAAR